MNTSPTTDSAQLPYALITGAASGLGLDLARALSSTHALILVDVNEPALMKLQAEFPTAQFHVVDLAIPEMIRSLCDRLSEWGTQADSNSTAPQLALLINNAGITHRSLASHTRHEVIQRVMQIDFLAPVQLTQGLLPWLTRSKGKIVNIGSMAGWMPVLGRSGYCAAKSALHQYFETLRAEVADDGISVLMAYPSFLDTPIEHNALSGDGSKATHPRSMVGAMHSSEWMAQRIVTAIQTGRERIFGDAFTYTTSVLYKVWPSLYLKLMRKRLASELNPHQVTH